MKNILKKLGWGFLVLFLIIMIFVIPIGLNWLIPTNDSPTQTNDWIGFFGSYVGGILGGVCTLVVMYFTRKDTRDIQKENLKIQNKIIDQEKENILKENRTFISYYKLKSNPFFSNMGDIYKSAMYVLDEDTILTERVLKLENPGAYDVGDVEKSYTFPIIEDRQTLIFPLFKIDENINIYHFRVSKMILKYDSGLVGYIESNTISIDFNENQEANSKINVEILEEKNGAEMNVRIPIYRII